MANQHNKQYYIIMNHLEKLIGLKVGGTRVVPIVSKIVILFAILLLVSNFSSNFINLTLNRGELLKLANRLLVKDLKEIYGQASNQHDIFEFSRDLTDAIDTISGSARRELTGKRSFAAGIRVDGSLFFWASASAAPAYFDDQTALASMRTSLESGDGEGILRFRLNGSEYFSVYKYHAKWQAFLLRAEEESEFYASTRSVFFRVSLIIILMTLVCLVVGIILLRRILRFVNRFATELMRMQNDQKLELIDLSDAPNDDVTYMGASFNSLASTIDNLLVIFRRFVTQDISKKAYADKNIRLEGTTKDLSILFTDIKGFTYMTETLGNDIIDLLNLHYDKAISHIHKVDGIVGSIIGDALLAVFGTLETRANKSQAALEAAINIQYVAAELRTALKHKSDAILRTRGHLLPAEERVLKAILLEVGVGIDGGEVFYGNIGSYERMANTVIGDNVNSSSRLEGLTRIYKVPIICSEYIRNDVLSARADYRFVELDQVQVKGKMEGKKIYWPVPLVKVDEAFERQAVQFELGLGHYYTGHWDMAGTVWQGCELPMMEEFNNRLALTRPENWNGIWAMTTK